MQTLSTVVLTLLFGCATTTIYICRRYTNLHLWVRDAVGINAFAPWHFFPDWTTKHGKSHCILRRLAYVRPFHVYDIVYPQLLLRSLLSLVSPTIKYVKMCFVYLLLDVLAAMAPCQGT